MKNLVFFLLFVSMIAMISCKNDEETKPNAPDISVIDISNESNWDYCILGKEDYFFLKANGSIPEGVLFYSAEADKNYSIFFTDNGYLDKVVVDDYIFSFKNPNGNRIDIGIIYPNGNIEVLRDLETNYDWDNYDLKSTKSLKAWSDVIRWTGRVVSGVPCALTAAAAYGTAGVGTPLAAWTCGNYFSGLAADIMVNELEIHNGFTAYMTYHGATATIGSCSSGIDLWAECASGVASTAFSSLANHIEDIEENRKDDVQINDAALEYGYGDVQITLTWDNIADLDLHVIDPNGEKIYWNEKSSSSGGVLDVDDIDGEGPENIYWPEYDAPSGDYGVYVHMYPWDESDYISYTGNSYYPGNSNYTVLVNAFGKTEKFTGSISYDETIHITDFDQNGLKSTSVRGSYSITKSDKIEK